VIGWPPSSEVPRPASNGPWEDGAYSGRSGILAAATTTPPTWRRIEGLSIPPPGERLELLLGRAVVHRERLGRLEEDVQIRAPR